MRVLYRTKEVNNALFEPLAEAHQRNYNMIYSYDNCEPLEIEEVEGLVKPRTYEQAGKLVDLIGRNLNKAYETKELSKLITISKVLFENGSMIVFVDSDYFKERVGVQILMNGNFYVRLCPWADGNFAKPFVDAYEEWITELTDIH